MRLAWEAGRGRVWAGKNQMKRVIWILLALVAGAGVAAVGVLVGLYIWLNAFLSGDDFRALVSHKVSEVVGVEGEFQPFRWSGFSVHSDGFAGTGVKGAPVRRIEVSQIRAELNIRMLFGGFWQIESLNIKQAKVEFRDPDAIDPHYRAALAAPPEVSASSLPALLLPKQFRLDRTVCEDAVLAFPVGKSTGSVKGVRLEVQQEGGGEWRVDASGGKLALPYAPELNLVSARLRVNPPELHILNSSLTTGSSGGNLSTSGVVSFGEGTDANLSIDFQELDVAPLLAGDWRARLTGQLRGLVQLSVNEGSKVEARGDVELINGVVKALPGLDRYDQFIPTSPLRNFRLDEAKTTLHVVGDRFDLSNVRIESRSLLRVEGDATSDAGALDGTFFLGTTDKMLSKIPGAKEGVFNVNREGYNWTQVKISGTLEDPEEDLTPRLADAVQRAVMQQAEGMIKGAVDILQGILQ